MVEIKKSVLDKILEWSTPPYDENKILDHKIVAALLLSCVGVDKLAKHEIEDDAKDFVKSKTKLVITKIVFSNWFFFFRDNGNSSQRIGKSLTCSRKAFQTSLLGMGK